MTEQPIIPSARPVVKVHAVGAGRLLVACEVPGCLWDKTGHLVKAGAEEEARHHRDAHRRAAQAQS